MQGRLEWREWETQDGQKRQAVDIIAESVQFLGGRDDASGGRLHAPRPADRAATCRSTSGTSSRRRAASAWATTTFRSRQRRIRWQSSEPSREKPGRRREKRGGPSSGRRKPCLHCKDKVDQVDYRDVATLRKFISEKGKIRSRRISGACRRHQSQIARAVKRARELALLPYVNEGAVESTGGRRDRDRDRDR